VLLKVALYLWSYFLGKQLLRNAPFINPLQKKIIHIYQRPHFVVKVADTKCIHGLSYYVVLLRSTFALSILSALYLSLSNKTPPKGNGFFIT